MESNIKNIDFEHVFIYFFEGSRTNQTVSMKRPNATQRDIFALWAFPSATNSLLPFLVDVLNTVSFL